MKSWGVFIGVFGETQKHIVLAQNSFKYTSDGFFDIDYTSIPLTWGIELKVIMKGCVERAVASKLVNSFLLGGMRRASRRVYQ
ncbi:hypothetical protein MUP01_04675, partial [Candidatus Bathyarchaeota archaeon]|nr:hypothetical protein [Candidatus Bathyarchaeota archaeon]